MTYILYIVSILCIFGIVLGHIFLFYLIYKGITENDERIRRADCRTIAEHVGEYMAYKERIGEGSGVSVQSVVRYLMDNYDLQEDTVTVQGNEIAVLSGNGKDGFLKVVIGDDNQVYIEFLDDNGINSIKPGALITDLSDIDGALA